MITENRTSYPGALEHRIETLIRRGQLDSVEKCHIELRRMAKIIDQDNQIIADLLMRCSPPMLVITHKSGGTWSKSPAKIHAALYGRVVDQKPVAIHHEVEIEPATGSALDTFAAKAGIVGGQGRTGGAMVASALYVLGGLALLAIVIVAAWVMSIAGPSTAQQHGGPEIGAHIKYPQLSAQPEVPRPVAEGRQLYGE